MEAGVGYVSEGSYKFGEYNGLQDDGAFPIGNATARYRDENAGFLDLRLRDLGLDTRSAEIEGGRQGSYRLFLNYDEIRHNISDSVMTPYLGSGSDSLSLPPSWVRAGSTSGMTELKPSLNGVDLYTTRKKLGIGVAFIPADKWETAISVRHESRDGKKRTAGNFYFNGAQLVEPVDYDTDEVEVAVTYTTKKWQSRLAYYGSFFSNSNRSLYWENAYNPLVAGADAGERALPPDNTFHQILFSSGYLLSDRTRISGDVALGRMGQDENLLAATTNPNLAVALPVQSVDAQVDTLTANLKVDSAVSNKLRLNASWRYNDRNNRTPSYLFDIVLTDTFAAPSRRNLPYSFTDNTAKLGGTYLVSNKTRLSAGYEYENRARTNQEVDETTEHSFWGKVNFRARENFDFSVKAEHANRDNSGYHPVAEITPADNPLMRKYNLADRTRDSAGLTVAITPNERISIGVSMDVAKDDYTDSLVGLTGDREFNLNADVSVILTEKTTLHSFAGQQLIRSEQAGSESYSTPDWFAMNDDTVDTFGFGVKHQLIEDRLDVGADYVLTRSTGRISYSNGMDFPDLQADLDTLKLYANYHLKDNMNLHAEYWYERYDSTSWMLDGVEPDTIPNVISFGEVSPDYNVNVFMVSVRYDF